MSLFICISMSFLLSVVASPFHVGALVLGLSVVSAIILSSATTWFSLILLLMYVGGMLVTFAYFLALCPNQIMGLSPMMVVPFLFGLMLLSSLNSLFVVKSEEMCNIYEVQNFVIFIILGVVLFLAMVSVVKMVSRPFGALRPFTS
nr:NADH dehydrogenase subunit 6 [Armandia sp. GK-2021]